MSTTYRYFIAKEDNQRKELVIKNYHYQASATSLVDLWKRIDVQLRHYNTTSKSYAFLIPSIKRHLKASSIDSKHNHKIGYTSDGHEIYVHKLSFNPEPKVEPKPAPHPYDKDHMVYYRCTPRFDGYIDYIADTVYHTTPWMEKYDVEECDREEFERGIASIQRRWDAEDAEEKAAQS